MYGKTSLRLDLARHHLEADVVGGEDVRRRDGARVPDPGPEEEDAPAEAVAVRQHGLHLVGEHVGAEGRQGLGEIGGVVSAHQKVSLQLFEMSEINEIPGSLASLLTM